MTLALRVANLTAVLGLPISFGLDASFTETADNAVPQDLVWRATLTVQGRDALVASGHAIPAQFNVTFSVAGSVRITAFVSARGYPEHQVRAVMNIVAPPAMCQPEISAVNPIPIPEKNLGTGPGEPNIVAAPDGTLYVNPVAPLFRSTDGGASFQAVGSTDGHSDADLAVDSLGRLHWLGLFGNAGPVPYQVSTDQGTTFNSSTDISVGRGRDREWIDATGNSTIYASWRSTSRTLEFVTSKDGGAHWGPIVTIGRDGLAGRIFHSRGAVYEPIVRGIRLSLAISLDDGATWKERPVTDLPASVTGDPLLGPTSVFPAGAADCEGRVYLVYSAENGEMPTDFAIQRLSRYGVFLTSSSDGGNQWTTPRLISTPGHAAVLPWVVAGGPGKVAAAWYENQNGLPNAMIPDLWDVKLWESVHANNPSSVAVKATLTTSPAHIGSVCASGVACLAGGDRSLLDFMSVTLDARGQPRAAWMSTTPGTGIGVQLVASHVWFGGANGTPLN